MPISKEARLHNMVLDFLYSRICKGKTNQEIFRELESKAAILPPMSDEQLDAVRQRFKEKEHQFPDKMAEIRKRLKV